MPAKICILSSVHSALDNRVFYREACSLQRAGYDVTLIAVHGGDEVRQGVQILGLPSLPRWKRPLVWLTLLRKAMRTRADVYHFHDPELLVVIPWLRLLTGKPTIYDVHESNAEMIEIKAGIPKSLRGLLTTAVRWGEPLLARLNSGLIFADDQIAQAFAGVARPKTTLFNYPGRALIDAAADATRGQNDRPPIVLYLGGIKAGRGPFLMLEAFSAVLEVHPEAQLWLVGPITPPDLEQALREAARQANVDHAVTMTGPVPFDQVGEFLNRAAIGWVALQPSAKFQKNIPTKLFEYMAYALPVVSSDLAPIRPYFQGQDLGLLVTADDPSAHAQAIVTLLDAPHTARAMGKRGQQLVQERFNWDAMESRLLDLYRAVSARPDRNP